MTVPTLQYLPTQSDHRHKFALWLRVIAYVCILPSFAIMLNPYFDFVHRGWITSSWFNTLDDAVRIINILGFLCGIAAACLRFRISALLAAAFNIFLYLFVGSFVYATYWQYEILPHWMR